MGAVKRTRFIITGQVQGVGFRPFVFRLASQYTLSGSVRNTPQGVIIEAQGKSAQVCAFALDLREKLPPLARIITFEQEDIAPQTNEADFKILSSTSGTGHTVLISPDIATCPDCLQDIRDPHNPRYRYPFTNCTNCGPRYTITHSIPYDRPFTSMACFPLCSACQKEYDDPMDRRFHAQPNACPVCGPQVWCTDSLAQTKSQGSDALDALAKALLAGKIVAIKGLGGFHLACDAHNESAVSLLRKRKNRPSKPLAIMVPDLDAARNYIMCSEQEEAWLHGMYRPIVLCSKKKETLLAPSIAPDTNFLGLMLPYTPLHHILFELLEHQMQHSSPALVMTSANKGGEPICLGNREALSRLNGIADFFCFHNRDILIRADDSVLRVNPRTGKTLFIRRARGFAPSPISFKESGPCVLGLGPELKCTISVTKNDQAFPSQHIGDMQNLETLNFHQEISRHLMKILQVEPELIVHDLHPDYMTSTLAKEDRHTKKASVQHHYAHIHACLAENTYEQEAIGIALDGTGYGHDGSIWGGEILYVNPQNLKHQRLAHLMPFPLPGGEQAVREPWRIAFAVLYQLGISATEGSWPWLPEFLATAQILPQMLDKGLNCPWTSSAGRLFDAVSALVGLCNTVSYEAQAAILLENEQDMKEKSAYPFPLSNLKKDDSFVLNTKVFLQALVDDIFSLTPVPIIARRFHLSLARGLADAAASFAKGMNIDHVALSGGVMLNLTLATELASSLEAHGLVVLEHSLLPPGDGCVSLGQAAWGRRLLQLQSE